MKAFAIEYTQTVVLTYSTIIWGEDKEGAERALKESPPHRSPYGKYSPSSHTEETDVVSIVQIPEPE